MAIEEKLADDLMKLNYEFPVEYVYNPIKHAKELHYNFLKRYYTEGPKPILFLGMNPGPWGMVQTGNFRNIKNYLNLSYNFYIICCLKNMYYLSF